MKVLSFPIQSPSRAVATEVSALLLRTSVEINQIRAKHGEVSMPLLSELHRIKSLLLESVEALNAATKERV